MKKDVLEGQILKVLINLDHRRKRTGALLVFKNAKSAPKAYRFLQIFCKNLKILQIFQLLKKLKAGLGAAFLRSKFIKTFQNLQYLSFNKTVLLFQNLLLSFYLLSFLSYPEVFLDSISRLS